MDVATNLKPEDYMGLVISIANKMRVPPGVERDDLIGAAMEALVREGPKFDPARGVPEKRWVGALVERRMVDEIRRQCGSKGEKMTVSLDAPSGDDADVTWVSQSSAPSEISVEMIESSLSLLTAKQRESVTMERPANVTYDAWRDRQKRALRRIVNGPPQPRKRAKRGKKSPSRGPGVAPATELGRMIRDAIHSRGLSYRAAAKEIGVGHTWLFDRVTRGDDRMRIPQFAKLIEWLGVDFHTAAKAMDQ
jgi:hypothetical protein